MHLNADDRATWLVVDDHSSIDHRNGLLWVGDVFFMGFDAEQYGQPLLLLPKTNVRRVSSLFGVFVIASHRTEHYRPNVCGAKVQCARANDDRYVLY